MAKLKLTLPVGEVAVTGKQVSFVAPCDSAGLTHLIIENFEFELVDSNGNNLLDGAFKNEAMVSVLLNVESAKAFIQNADINYQLKQSFDKKVDLATAVVNDEPTRVKEVPDTSSPYASVKEIGGMTRKWNQLFVHKALGWSATTNGVTLIVNNDGSITLNGQATSRASFGAITNNISVVGGHKYYIDCGDTTIHCGWDLSTAEDNGNEQITTALNDLTAIVQLDIFSTERVFNNFTFYPKIVDLTEIYGAGKEPTSVADLHINRGFEPYDTGSLHYAKVTEVESVGANVLDDASITLGPRWDINDDGYIVPTSQGMFRVITPMKLKPNTTYFVSCANSTLGKWAVWFTDENYKALGRTDGWSDPNSTFTTPSFDCYAYFTGWYNATEYQNDIMINEGTTALPYTPYVKHTLPIPTEVQSLDGYGWGVNESVYNYIDYEKKQFVKRVGKMDMGTQSYATDSTDNYAYITAIAKKDYSPVLCSHYPEHITNIRTNKFGDIIVYFEAGAFTSAGQVKAAMSGVMLIYELATPEVTDISEYLLDNNLKVEAGGTVTMVNEYDYDVPSVVNFTTNNNEIVGADTFVGDLKGTAARALSDSEGNEIKYTYLKTAKVLSVDSDGKQLKDVPEGSAPYAEIIQVGGRTRKCTNFWTLGDIVATYYTHDVTGVFEILTPNKQYTLTWKYSSNGTADTQNAIIIYTEAGSITITSGFSFTITEAQLNTIQGVYAYFGSDATSGSMTEIMLNEGTEPLPYEPYFEGLRSAPVSSVESVGVNLIPFPYSGATGNTRGVKWTINDDRSVTANGTATEDSIFVLQNWNIHLKKGTYNLSGIPAEGLGSTFMIQFASFSNKEYAKNVIDVEGVQLTLKEDLSDCIVQCVVFAGYTANNLTFKPMLNKGTKALPYKPYTCNTLPIPEAVRALDGYGLGIDDTYYNYIDWGKKQFVRRVKKIVFNGSEDWIAYAPSSTGEYNYYRCKIGELNYAKDEIALSSSYDCADISYSNANVGVDIANSSSYSSCFVYVRPADYADMTTSKWKEYLDSNPLTVVYALTTPEIVDISDILPDFVLPTENGGIVRMVNEYNYDLPNTVVFYKGDVKHSTFVGTLKGQASHANLSNFAVRDSEGNVIKDTYCLAPIVSQTDITAGVTPLAKGQSYHVYE